MKKVFLGLVAITIAIGATVIGVDRHKINATMDLVWANVEALAEDDETSTGDSSEGVKTIVTSTEVETQSHMSGTYLVTCYIKKSKVEDCKDKGILRCEKGATSSEVIGCEYTDMSGGGELTR